jgi:hypothetical protein
MLFEIALVYEFQKSRIDIDLDLFRPLHPNYLWYQFYRASRKVGITTLKPAAIADNA